jgi:hypothetical protein
MESLRLEFKQESERLPRQIRAMAQQVLGETKGKRDAEVIEISGAHTGPGATTSAGTQVNPGGLGNPGVPPILTSSSLIIKFTPTGQDFSRYLTRIFLGHRQMGVRVITECRRTLENKWLGLSGCLDWSLEVGLERTTNLTQIF